MIEVEAAAGVGVDPSSREFGRTVEVAGGEGSVEVAFHLAKVVFGTWPGVTLPVAAVAGQRLARGRPGR